MSVIFVVDTSGKEHELPASPGQTLLEVMKEAAVPVRATCSGCCVCHTCHVSVAEEWIDRLPPIDPVELLTVSESGIKTARSRLACQIIFEEDLNGLRVRLTEDTIP